MKLFVAIRWVGVFLALGATFEGVVAAQESQSSSSAREECSVRLEKFIAELDGLLDKNNRSLSPLTELLKRYFPIVNCDLSTAIEIFKRSKYLVAVEDQPSLYVFTFTNANSNSPSQSGFDVIFGLLKKSGDSRLPFARVRP